MNVLPSIIDLSEGKHGSRVVGKQQIVEPGGEGNIDFDYVIKALAYSGRYGHCRGLFAVASYEHSSFRTAYVEVSLLAAKVCYRLGHLH